MASIEIKNLIKKFDGNEILKNISLEVKDGEFLVLVGPSGCGKSTLLRSIAGLEEIDSGLILIDDKCVNNLHPSKRDVAFVFQTYALYPQMTVFENMAFPLKIAKKSKEEIKEKVLKASSMLNLDNFLNRKPRQLSGGQRQRVALGRAIVRQPKVFLMDEPLSNLDAKLRTEMRLQLKLLHNKLKTTFIYVTHDQTEAMTLGDRIAIMQEGKILQIDKGENVYKKPALAFVASFIGNFPMNILKFDVFNNSEIEINKQRISLPKQFDKKSVFIGLRAENFQSNSKDAFKLKVPVDFVEILGDEKVVHFRLNDQRCKGKFNADFRVFENEIELSLCISDFLFFDCETGKNLAFNC